MPGVKASAISPSLTNTAIWPSRTVSLAPYLISLPCRSKRQTMVSGRVVGPLDDVDELAHQLAEDHPRLRRHPARTTNTIASRCRTAKGSRRMVRAISAGWIYRPSLPNASCRHSIQRHVSTPRLLPLARLSITTLSALVGRTTATGCGSRKRKRGASFASTPLLTQRVVKRCCDPPSNLKIPYGCTRTPTSLESQVYCVDRSCQFHRLKFLAEFI